MARADVIIGRISGHTQAGFTPEGDVHAGGDVAYDSPLGPGTIERRTLYVAGGAFVLLFLYWRAAKGY